MLERLGIFRGGSAEVDPGLVSMGVASASNSESSESLSVVNLSQSEGLTSNWVRDW